jgi:hypothetical protein
MARLTRPSFEDSFRSDAPLRAFFLNVLDSTVVWEALLKHAPQSPLTVSAIFLVFDAFRVAYSHYALLSYSHLGYVYGVYAVKVLSHMSPFPA